MIDENNILVTIGIPFYKDVDTLAYAIRSVQKQTWKNFELILIDDGGKDGSMDVARRFLDDGRIRLISDGQNKGLPKRLNELITLAKGKYFARMDADDIMHPERIRKQVLFLEDNPDIDVVGTGAISIDANNNILGEKIRKPVIITEHELFRHTPVMHPTVLAKASWYKVNRYSEDATAIRAEDFELWCRTWSYTKIANIGENLLFYREGNSINKSIENQLMTYDNTIKSILKYAPKYLSRIEIYTIIMKLIVRKIIWKSIDILQLKDLLSKYIFRKRFKEIDDKLLINEKIILSSIINDA